MLFFLRCPLLLCFLRKCSCNPHDLAQIWLPLWILFRSWLAPHIQDTSQTPSLIPPRHCALSHHIRTYNNPINHFQFCFPILRRAREHTLVTGVAHEWTNVPLAFYQVLSHLFFPLIRIQVCKISRASVSVISSLCMRKGGPGSQVTSPQSLHHSSEGRGK